MNKLRGMILGAFVSDALSLGAHWIYDQELIKTQWHEENAITAPLTPYHKGKVKGDFTHYGDQVLFLHNHLISKQEISKDTFYSAYLEFMQTYSGYKDHATLKTIEHIIGESSEGSTSNELGGLTGLYSLLWYNYPSYEKTIDQVQVRTKLTHNDELLLLRASFIVKWTYGVLEGKKPSLVLQEIRKECHPSIEADILKAEELLSYSAEMAIKMLGQSCDSNNAFPSVVFLVLKHEESFKDAMFSNIYAGGDSAARGMILGGLLGAYHGENSLPVDWLASMTHLKKIEALMDSH